MRHSRRWVFSSLLALALAPVGAWAQQGSIYGMLTYRGQPLASAGVSAYLLDQSQTRYTRQWTTATAPDGAFQMKGLPYGTYVVVMRYRGRIVYQNKVTLSSAGQEIQVDLKS
ncbi:MAG: carboxypeptidase-like regulatory domain-containing protein [Bryobacteraceae bacterium]|jgi:hypothetical protein